MNGRPRDIPGYIAEPVRLLAGGGSTYERRLLESADLDVMPSATPERLARALDAPEVIAALDLGARAGATRWGSRGWVRLGAAGGLAGLGLIAASVAALLAGEPTTPLPAETGPSMPNVPPAMVAAPVELPPSVSSPEPLAAPPVEPAVESPSRAAAPETPRLPARARTSAAAASPAAPRRPGTPAPAGDGLLEEVRLLERVRASLRAGQSGPARRLLEEYRARFAHGELAFEADLLEAERAHADGDGAGARLLARQLLARPGAARHRARLTRLLSAEPSPAHDEGSVRSPAHMDARRSNP